MPGPVNAAKGPDASCAGPFRRGSPAARTVTGRRGGSDRASVLGGGPSGQGADAAVGGGVDGLSSASVGYPAVTAATAAEASVDAGGHASATALRLRSLFPIGLPSPGC
jgi:hypothetical protein